MILNNGKEDRIQNTAFRIQMVYLNSVVCSLYSVLSAVLETSRSCIS